MNKLKWKATKPALNKGTKKKGQNMPNEPTAVKEPKTIPQNLRELRAFLLKPGPDLSELSSIFDAVVEGRYESLLHEMAPNCPKVIQIIQAMVASRPFEFVDLLDMLETNIVSKYLTERNENFTCACLIGLIKGMTIINDENMRYLLEKKVDVALKINTRFVSFAVFLLKQIGINTAICYKTELSDAVAVFIGDSVTGKNNEWVQLSLLIKDILREPELLVGGKAKPKNFIQVFLEELSFKIWSRVTPEMRLKVLHEGVMVQ